MVFIWGKRLMGKVDVVKGRFYVATQFFMLWYLPLVPLDSYIILSEQRKALSGTFTGVAIPLSVKSWAMAWIRTLAVIPAAFSGAFGLILLFPIIHGDKLPNNMVSNTWLIFVCSAIPLAATYIVPGFSTATESRAAYLERFLEQWQAA